MFKILAFYQMNEKQAGERNAEIDRKEGAKEEAGDAVADMSGVDEGGKNNCHEDISEEGGFNMS